MRKEQLKIYNQAKKDFDMMIKNSTEKQIKKAVSGYGISSCVFAHQYTKSGTELYKKIYNIMFNWFENYSKLLK